MVSFTTFALLLYACAHALASHTLGSVAVPTLWGVATSFSVAPLLDPDCYERIRRRRGWSVPTFWVGNLALHFVPLCFPPPLHPAGIEWHHGAAATALHVGWWILESNGTFLLDATYVSATPCTWYTATEVLLVPAFL